MYYLEVVDISQMSEEQPIGSRPCFIRTWALEAGFDLPPGFWRAASGTASMTTEQYLSFFDKRLSVEVKRDCYGLQESMSQRELREFCISWNDEIADSKVKRI